MDLDRDTPGRAPVNPIVGVRATARRARTRRVRRAVAGGAASIFAALWLVIYVQLASGRDPVQAGGSTASSLAISTPATVAAASTQVAAQSITTDAAAQSAPTPMSTRQS